MVSEENTSTVHAINLQHVKDLVGLYLLWNQSCSGSVDKGKLGELNKSWDRRQFTSPYHDLIH